MRWVVICGFVTSVLLARGEQSSECDGNYPLPPDHDLVSYGCSREDLAPWLSPAAALPGYYVLCIGRKHTPSAKMTTMSAFANGSPTDSPIKGALNLPPNTTAGWEIFRRDLATALQLKSHVDPWYDADGFFQLCRNKYKDCQPWADRGECSKNPNFMLENCGGSCGTCNASMNEPEWSRQRWGLFTAVDQMPVGNLKALDQGGVFLLFEGGQFIWPGIEIGYERPLHLGDGQEVTLRTLALRPVVIEVLSFLSDEECSHVIGMSAPHMRASKVALMDKDKGKDAQDFRTSQTHFLASKTSTLQRIDDRVARLTRVPRQHQEFVQVLKYSAGQFYDHHVDYWDPDLYQEEEWLSMVEGGFSNRLATVFWYMSDVGEVGGGETNFPLADVTKQGGGVRPGRGSGSSSQCASRGLSVEPKRGKVIIFYSLKPDGSGDKDSLHGACSVRTGSTKWAGNKWVWNKAKQFIP